MREREKRKKKEGVCVGRQRSQKKQAKSAELFLRVVIARVGGKGSIRGGHVHRPREEAG